MKIKIISDTTCDLPEQLLKEYQITLLPLHITKGEESLLDGVQIMPSDIFSYVDAGGEICTTASINPQEYAMPLPLIVRFTMRSSSSPSARVFPAATRMPVWLPASLSRCMW